MENDLDLVFDIIYKRRKTSKHTSIGQILNHSKCESIKPFCRLNTRAVSELLLMTEFSGILMGSQLLFALEEK